MTIIKIRDTALSQDIVINENQLKSYSDYQEICLTGLALPDASLTFTAEVDLSANTVGYGAKIYIYNASSSGTNLKLRLIRYVTSVERISQNIYTVTGSGYLSNMTEKIVGDYYEQKTVQDILMDITNNGQIIGTDGKFKITDEDLSAKEISMYINVDTTRRDALQTLLFFANAALIETVNSTGTAMDYIVTPITAINTQTPKSITSTNIFQGTSIEDPENYDAITINIDNYGVDTSTKLQPYYNSRGEIAGFDPYGPCLVDHIVLLNTKDNVKNAKVKLDDMYVRELTFANFGSYDIYVANSDGGETKVGANKTTAVTRKSTNEVEMRSDYAMHVNVYGFKYYHNNQTITKTLPSVTDPKNVLNVTGGGSINPEYSETILNLLYDYFVENPRKKCNMKFVSTGFNVGDRVTFPLEYGGTGTGIITSMERKLGNKNVAEATIAFTDN